MRTIRFDLSLTVLVPLILAGVSFLAIIFADLATPGLRAPNLMWLCAICAGIVYVTATVMLLLILGPMRRFLAKAGAAMVLAPQTDPRKGKATAGELAYFDRMFGQVADVLSKLDAKALFPEIIGESRAMRGVFTMILKAAPSDATVLLTGESGVGKELAAKSLYAHSPRAKGPFVAVNCAAIPEGLLESELFGHEKGAFTDAVAMKKGKFELANGGVLFLDEIGDMPLGIQAKILRVLQNRECERVGGAKPVKLDIRVVAATNRYLADMVASGAFREDLFHRINVINILIPPLRERRQDIPLLASRFLEAAGREQSFSTGALQRLMAYDWPGNVRELANVVERAAVMSEKGAVIRDANLPERGAPASLDMGGELDFVPPAEADAPGGLDDRLGDMEKSLILAALTRAGGVQARAAELLGIKQRSLWHRIKKYDIDPSAVKRSLRGG